MSHTVSPDSRLQAWKNANACSFPYGLPNYPYDFTPQQVDFTHDAGPTRAHPLKSTPEVRLLRTAANPGQPGLELQVAPPFISCPSFMRVMPRGCGGIGMRSGVKKDVPNRWGGEHKGCTWAA